MRGQIGVLISSNHMVEGQETQSKASEMKNGTLSMFFQLIRLTNRTESKCEVGRG